MKLKTLVPLALGASLLLVSGFRFAQWKPLVTEDDRLKGSYRFERNGWIYVHLEGSPDKIGYQHGSLLAKETQDLLRVLKPFLQHETKHDWNFYRQASQEILWPKIDVEFQTEIDGIVRGLNDRGVKADRWDIVALNALEELPYYYVPWLDKKQGRLATTHAPGNCSAMVATGSYTKDHRIVMGHNAWTNYIVGSRWNIVFDIKPQRGYRILMDGLPGVITSDDDFGVNSAGIMITETTITGFASFDPAGSPEFYRARKALQYSNSIDVYVRIMLEGNNGGYANDWLIADTRKNEIASLELGLKNVTLERKTDGYFVGSNFPINKKLAAEETTFDLNNPGLSGNARHKRWEQLMQQNKGKIDVAAAQKFLADHVDSVTGKAEPSERTLCGHVDLSPRGMGTWQPAFGTAGAVQNKATDATMASKLAFAAAAGHACGHDFIAAQHLAAHPELAWQKPELRDMKAYPWTQIAAE
jgi:hypothetical protein